MINRDVRFADMYFELSRWRTPLDLHRGVHIGLNTYILQSLRTGRREKHMLKRARARGVGNCHYLVRTARIGSLSLLAQQYVLRAVHTP
jgi:hypothetical protein